MSALRIALIVTVLVALHGCDSKPESASSQVKESIDDALDRRPNEQIRDAAEDLEKGFKNAVEDLKGDG